MERRGTHWIIAAATLAATLVAGDARADCASRLDRAAARFTRVVGNAIDACGREHGTCPDARLETQIAHFEQSIADSLAQRCPDLDVAGTLAAIVAQLLCDELAVCPASGFGHMTVTLTAGGASRADIGWTGLAHDRRLFAGATFTADLSNCDGSTDTSCTVNGATSGTPFAPPVPLSTGGVATCLTSNFASDVAGTVDVASGDLDLAAAIGVGVFVGLETGRPCPVCVVADPQVGKHGICNGGPNNGLPCTVGALNDPTFGANDATSFDCPPNPAANIGTVTIALDPTTGTSTLSPNQTCTSIPFNGKACYCQGQKQANQCDDAICTDPSGTGGTCEAGPFDQFCSIQTFRGCLSDSDCPSGAGNCQGAPVLRPCSGQSDPDTFAITNDLTRNGTPSTTHPVLASTFCMGGTMSAAVNTAEGLPGPTGAVFAAETVFTP